VTTALSRQEVTDLYARWDCISERLFRGEVCDVLGFSATNLDKMIGLPLDRESQGIGQLIPATAVRKSEAAKAFGRRIARYESLRSMAAKGSVNRTLTKTEIAHLRQAAVVLGVGSFDSYIRSFVIERYLSLIFETGTPPTKVVRSWEDSIKRAIDVEPGLLTIVAGMDPKDAQRHLAETVFAVHNVRLLTGRFESAVKSLATVNISIGVDKNNPSMDPTEQLLQLADPVFDAFACARHWAVHTGTASHGAQPYCTNQEPIRFLGTFLGALVTIIEGHLLP
jgi:hypothetical protein